LLREFLETKRRLKTFRKSGNNVTLIPSNSTMSPMQFAASDVAIFGKVVTVMRRL